jgi:hypothetical protein
MPKHHARRIILHMKVIELLAEFAVVTLFRFFELEQISVQLFFVAPSGAIDALQHLVIAITTPISACQLHQLKRFKLAGIGHMWTTAQISKAAFGVK